MPDADWLGRARHRVGRALHDQAAPGRADHPDLYDHALTVRQSPYGGTGGPVVEDGPTGRAVLVVGGAERPECGVGTARVAPLEHHPVPVIDVSAESDREVAVARAIKGRDRGQRQHRDVDGGEALGAVHVP